MKNELLIQIPRKYQTKLNTHDRGFSGIILLLLSSLDIKMLKLYETIVVLKVLILFYFC